MDILLYLSELLQQQASVGIADLGTFYKKKFAGRYDKEKQSFLPPGYTLQFTASLKDENLLPDFISAKRNISKESAEYYISQFVEETNQKLEVEHEAVLENIGRLFYTEHEGLSFEPFKNINYGSEFFGLPNVVETQLVDEPQKVSIIEKNLEPIAEISGQEIFEEIAEAPTPVEEDKKTKEQLLPVIENIELDEVKDDLKHTLPHNEDIEIVDIEHEEVKTPASEEPKTYVNLNDDDVAKQPISEAPEFIKEQHAEHPNRFGHDPLADEFVQEEEKSVWTKVWVGVATLIVIAAIIYFAKPYLFNKSEKIIATPDTIAVDTLKTEKVGSARIKQDSIAKTDSILKANQVQSKIDSQKAKSGATVTQQKPIEMLQKTGVTTYEVIGASFKTTKKAELFIEQMKGYGLKAKIVPIEGPYRKVSIASFKTEKEALDARPDLSKKIKIKELDIKQINTP